MLLKFNNIQDLSDARYAAAALAEWIGFRVGGDSDLSAGAIQEIIGWCAGPRVVLEVLPGTPAERVAGLLDVLPVDGIECSPSGYDSLKAAFGDRIREWIITGEAAQEGVISHVDNLSAADQTICRINPANITAGEIESAMPWAISLDCYPSASTGIKDFSAWNDLMEGLNIL